MYEMMKTVNLELAGEKITARWESLAPNDIGPDLYERTIVDETIALLEPGWTNAVLWVSLVGDAGNGGVLVWRSDGSVIAVELSEVLRGLLMEYKRITYRRDAGAWLSGHISIEGRNRYEVSFSWDSIPRLVQAPTVEDLRQELSDFPRGTEQIPTWMRQILE
ncbi:hypothetical protein ACIRRA_01830 [Nocardia sp. NPDC101769]|uniref:hypothetical protein n=1 Tax=Nocardia sp. NPDC101769 TaxID=3364333 RepID=UPI00382E7E40